MTAPRTALVVAVPEAAAAVDAWRERTSYAKPSNGVPAHVTVVYPFVPMAEVDDAFVAGLQVRGHPVLRLRAPRVPPFPAVLYLAPEPPEPFVSLTRPSPPYPGFPPYEACSSSSLT